MRDREVTVTLSPLGVHPLRLLQISQANGVFGPQQIELPEDAAVFKPLPSPVGPERKTRLRYRCS